MRYVVALLVLFTACSKDSTAPTKPAGHDPTALVTNSSPDTVVFAWVGSNGEHPVDTLKGAGTICERFTATEADSAYLFITLRQWDDSSRRYSAGSPWFTVRAAPAWRVELADHGSGASIRIFEDSSGVQC
jgi:hypothetical protein